MKIGRSGLDRTEKIFVVKCDYSNHVENFRLCLFCASRKSSAGDILPFELYPALSRYKAEFLEKLLSRPQDLGRLTKFQLLREEKKLGIKNATKLKKTQLINEIDDKVLKLVEEKQSSFKGFTNQFTLEPSRNVTFDPESFFTAVKRKAFAKIQTQTKVKIILKANMEKKQISRLVKALWKDINSDQKMKLFLN